MKKIFEKIKEWLFEPDPYAVDFQKLHESLKKEREERHAKLEKMSERELLVEIAKALTD